MRNWAIFFFLILAAATFCHCSVYTNSGLEPSLIQGAEDANSQAGCYFLAAFRCKCPTIPVLLLPDLFENRHVFLGQEMGFARTLTASGYDVYLGQWPTPNGTPGDMSFDDLVDDHVPALMQTVRTHSKQNQVTLIGHGIGGSAALVVAANLPNVKSVIAIGTPGRFLFPNKLFDWLIQNEPQLPGDLPVPTQRERRRSLLFRPPDDRSSICC